MKTNMIRPKLFVEKTFYVRFFLLSILVLPMGLMADHQEKGYNCLFLGHSFFAPIVKHLNQHALDSGFTDHEQYVVFHGGKNGTPGRLWASPKQDVQKAKKRLTSGDVDLVAMTYHFVDSEVEDYQRWIDLALKHNPKCKFVIQAPWAIKQDKSFEEYEKDVQAVLKNIHSIIDELRTEYPNNSFVCVPQGRWMVELWRLRDKNELPELKLFVSKGKQQSQNALFRDEFGHGGEIAQKEGALMWLRVIYDVDLKSYDYTPKTTYDIKALIQKICDENPYCRDPKNNKPLSID